MSTQDQEVKRAACILLRHTEKDGADGEATLKGLAAVYKLFSLSLVKQITSFESPAIILPHSNISRCEATAKAAEVAFKDDNPNAKVLRYEEPLLAEGNVAKFSDGYYKQEQERLGVTYDASVGTWLHAWLNMVKMPEPDMLTGWQVARNIATWVHSALDLDKLPDKRSLSLGVTHGPAMAAFLLRLQNLTGLKFLHDETWQKKPVFQNELDYLSRIYLYRISDGDAGQVNLFFGDQTHVILMEDIRTIAETEHPNLRINFDSEGQISMDPDTI